MGIESHSIITCFDVDESNVSEVRDRQPDNLPIIFPADTFLLDN